MFPQYTKIQRGQYLCTIIAFAICQWKIEVNATRFLALPNGHTIFLDPIRGALLPDFFVFRGARHSSVDHL